MHLGRQGKGIHPRDVGQHQSQSHDRTARDRVHAIARRGDGETARCGCDRDEKCGANHDWIEVDLHRP
jgi:hypothetical protein